MLNECPSVCGSAPPCTAFAQDPRGDPIQSLLFDDAPVRELRGAAAAHHARADWNEEELVFLHWRLLHELRRLCDPEHPLAEKIDTLNWVFTDPDKDAGPFSFANCLKVVGCSPLSPSPYVGRVDAEADPRMDSRQRHSVDARESRALPPVDARADPCPA